MSGIPGASVGFPTSIHDEASFYDDGDDGVLGSPLDENEINGPQPLPTAQEFNPEYDDYDYDVDNIREYELGDNGSLKSFKNLKQLGPYPSWIDHVPISTVDITNIMKQIGDKFGFQKSSIANMTDHLMTQLDSRASRLQPTDALTSLHASYIGGDNSNYKKWFFAAQFDLDEDLGFNKMKLCGKSGTRNKKIAKQRNINLREQRRLADERKEAFLRDKMKMELTPDQLERNFDFDVADYKWKQKMHLTTPREKIEQIGLYLLIWGEANQLRFLPECLCFIYKCAWDYYVSDACKLNTPPVAEFTYLNDVVTPIYRYLRDQSYTMGENGKLIKKEKDHKEIIGYDDMNQLFWYPEGIERITLRSPSKARIVDIPLEERYGSLKDVNWDKAFYKTYREKRTWLHVATNFNRIWIIHLCSFWFFTSFNSPTLYTKNYSQLIDNQPTIQNRLTIMAQGGTLACLIQLLATFSEFFFVPRNWPGAQPLMKRLGFLFLFLFLNFVPMPVILLTYGLETHSTVAFFASAVQLAFAIFTAAFFAVVPLGALFGRYMKVKRSQSESKRQRRYMSSRTFTASFPKFGGRRRWFSIFLWVSIFTAKFIESYFFLTLSIRDPIRVLSIMDLSRCVGDQLIGSLLCRQQAKIILGMIYFTDLVLFFLDTYLWYIVFNSMFSVGLSFVLGISIMTPWRNVYSRLPKRIYSKILATAEMDIKYKPKILISQIWNAVIISMYREHLLPIETVHKLLYQQIDSDVDQKKTLRSPSFFIAHDDATYRSNDYFPKNSEALRRISFFAQSLSTPIPEPIAVESMPVFTVLVPHYGEKILLPLREIIKEGSVHARITLLEYLKQLYPTEWDCFVKDTKLLAIEHGAIPDSSSKYDTTRKRSGSANSLDSTKASASLDKNVEELQSNKDTTKKKKKKKLKLKRGMELPEGEDGEPLIAVGDVPMTPIEENEEVPYSPDDNTRQGKINDLPFYCVGFKTSSPEFVIRTRIWASLRTQTLYRTVSGFSNYVKAIKLLYRIENPGIVQYYINNPAGLEIDLEEMANRKFKLLIAMQRLTKFNDEEIKATELMLRAFPSMKISYLEEEINPDDPEGEKIYYSCLIDGENQNLKEGERVPLYRVRLSGNPILGDGKSDNQNHSLIFYRGEYIQVVDANQDNYLEECIKIRSVLSEFEEMDLDTTPPYVAGIKYADEPPPVAIVGMREYIFSENIGVLGDIAAGKEQTFGTLFARTLAEIGGKLHYGHPDFLNAIFMTTRGGISKAQKGLHLNEDIYAGMNAMLRGGRIKHCDYYQCGKGRDLGFGSILNFTTKIGAGMGEQILSREYYYLGTQLPLDRFLSFYYAHPGFHINNLFITLSVQMFMIVMVNLGALVSESTLCKYNKDLPFTDLQEPIGCYMLQPVLNWVTIFVFSVFIVFFIAFVPLIVQELTERGLWKAFSRFFHHLLSLSPLFEVFVCQIYATSLITDVTFGGAKYISTGRGFATSRTQFFYLYSKFTGSSIYSGSKLFLMLLFSTITMWQPALLWFWLTLVSMCFAPFVFNPHQFAFVDFFLDYRDFIHWLSRGNAKFHVNSWVSAVKQSRAKYTGYKKLLFQVESELMTPDVRKSKLKNTYFSELVVPFLTAVLLFFGYTFINAQNGVKDVTPTNSILRLVALVFFPIVINVLTLAVIFACSCFNALLFTCCCGKKPASITAAIAHMVSVFVHLISFELVWFLEGWNFARTLACILSVISIQDFMFKFITIVLLSREFRNDKINRSWWSGNWFSKIVGPRIFTQPFRELIVKTMEMSLFAADFILGHCLLFVLTPFVFVPYVDRWHTMLLFWLRPGTLKGRILSKKRVHRRRMMVLRYMILYFLVLILFLAVVMVPALTHKFIPNFEDNLKSTPIDGFIQPTGQDNNDTGSRAPSTIPIAKSERPKFTSVVW